MMNAISSGGMRPGAYSFGEPAADPESDMAGGDMELGLMALQVRTEGTSLSCAEKSIESTSRAQQQALADQRAAEQAAEKAEHRASVWGEVATVAKVVGVVASVAASVVSGGSTLAVAAAIVGTGLTAGAPLAKKLGASNAVVDGLEVGGAALSLGTGLAAGGAAALSSAALAVKTGAMATEGGATVVQGGATMGQGLEESARLERQADGADAGNRADDAGDRQSEDEGDLQRAYSVHTAAARTISSMMSDAADAKSHVIANMRG